MTVSLFKSEFIISEYRAIGGLHRYDHVTVQECFCGLSSRPTEKAAGFEPAASTTIRHGVAIEAHLTRRDQKPSLPASRRSWRRTFSSGSAPMLLPPTFT